MIGNMVWVAVVLSCGAAATAEPAYRPILLFLQASDARDGRGTLSFEANPLQLRGNVELAGAAASAPADAHPRGFHPLLAVPRADGSCQVFACTHEEAGTEPRTFRWRLYRGLTPDGHRLTEWREVFRNPDGPWLIESLMIHQPTTGRLLFYTWSRHPQPEKGHAVWGFASDDGLAWKPLSGESLYQEHDAFGGMWKDATGEFLIAQVTQQAWKKPYGDNIGSGRRRVLTIRTSRDGVRWSTVEAAGPGGLITPDAHDPADLEFYRMHPFAYGDRYVAMADLYAASPLVPDKHGPHLTCEWWVSPDAIRWDRPWRSVPAQGEAPYPVKMSPMWFGREMLFWVGGQVFGLPEYRIASIGSQSNAEFSSRVFEMPARNLLLNAAVPAGRGLFNQAYVTVELQDETGRGIPGYGHDQCVLKAVDDTRIPLKWGTRTGQELAGRQMMLRFRLRGARVYAVGS